MIIQTEANFETYNKIMSGVTDKDNVLEFINSDDRVLDFGCGNGALTDKFDPANYVGYDLSELMVDTARAEHPEYRFTATFPEGEKFDVVLFSSVLHEVYSYSEKSFEKVVEVLKDAKNALTPTGRIVIRDGFVPDDKNLIVSYKLVNPADAKEFLSSLVAESQFEFRVEITADGNLVGGQRAVNRFLNVYTWGWKSFAREKDERVNFASTSHWKRLIEQAGLNINEMRLISQDGYFDNLRKIVDLEGDRWDTKIILSLAKA